MDDLAWLLGGLLAVVILVAAAVFAMLLVRHRVKAERDRAYKSLQEHHILNAGSREDWASGTISRKDDDPLDRHGSRLALITQIVVIVAFAGVMSMWNASLARQNERLGDRLSQLELQLHALALVGDQPVATAANRLEPTYPQAARIVGTPMELACANLVGRVADAYEKGESSKIGEALEALVTKLGCVSPPKHE